jgi:hypothetical protein
MQKRRLMSILAYFPYFEETVGLWNHFAIYEFLCVSTPIVTTQRLRIHVTAAKNTHVTIELLDAWFSMRSFCIKGK